MEQDASPVETEQPRGPRRIELARQTCVIRPERIDIRPSRVTLVPPLLGFLFGAVCFGLMLASILLWQSLLPFPLLVALLLISLIALPLSGMGLIYAAIGANVLIDRRKQSATWQQGLLGLGVGTTELVPFWKIEAILVEEPSAEAGRPTEEFAQWEIVLLKQSGKRLTIGRISTMRSLARESFARARDVAEAVAALTGAPLRVAEGPPDATAPAATPAMVTPARPAAPRARRTKRARRR